MKINFPHRFLPLFLTAAFLASATGASNAKASCDDGPSSCGNTDKTVTVSAGATDSNYAAGAKAGVGMRIRKSDTVYDMHLDVGLTGSPGILNPGTKQVQVVGNMGSSSTVRYSNTPLHMVTGNPALFQATAQHVDLDILAIPAGWIFAKIPNGIGVDYGNRSSGEGRLDFRVIPLGLLYQRQRNDDHATSLYTGVQVEAQQQLFEVLNLFARVKGGLTYASGDQQGAGLYGQVAGGLRGDLSKHVALEFSASSSAIAKRPDLPSSAIEHTRAIETGLSVIGAF
ncbi:MAG: hypothetical protein HY074_15995 [Deltaproteobacteria bacterium]|nr:hypothetical protein [Deltaproteobacteria bacterium]